MKPNALIRVALGFTRSSDLPLLQFAEVVADSLYGNPLYPAPPLTLEQFAVLVDGFRDAKTAQREGGKLATATKNAKKELLVKALRELAAYVQMVGGNDLGVLLSSGFEVITPGSNVPSVLEAPLIERVRLGQSGELITLVIPVRSARGYEAEIAEVIDGTTLGPWISAGFHTNSRRIIASGLTPGKTYAIRVRAMGGTTSQSDWSAPTTQMCL